MLAGIQIYILRALTLQFSGSRPCWLNGSKPDAATNSTRKSKAFAQTFDRQDFNTFSSSIPRSAFRSYLSLMSFAVFQWNWGTLFYKQTGRLDLNLNKTLLENAAECVHCEKYQGDSSVSWTQVISAGTFCLDWIAVLELLVTHGMSASRFFFSSFIYLSFLS